ncbi:MAG: biotin transporter BioY [Coriobacteriia bacterium]|nr:biotin transporter BioY [Coriobacteriia bacterium]
MSDARAAVRPAPRIAARTITTAALLAALLAASSLFALRLGPVPLTLQVLVVVLAALLLTPAQAALAVGVYLIEGAIGLPVFAGMLGGLGVLAGPTGGYLWGFLAGAGAGAALRTRLECAGADQRVADVAAAASVIVCVYVLGAVQLGLVAHLDVSGALAAGVVPFVGPDLLKAAAAVALASALRRTLARV